MTARTLNLGCGVDSFGTDKLDLVAYQPGVKVFDLNSNKPLPYPDNTFDKIRFHNTLELMLNPQFILEEIYRVLKPNGKLDLKEINARSLRFYLMRKTFSKIYTGIAWYDLHVGLFDEHTLRNRFKLTKFREVRIRKASNIRFFKDMIVVEAIK